jgi:DNA-binding MarR family transcriptional regulator
LDRREIVDEVMMLLPALGRGIGKPTPLEMAEISRQSGGAAGTHVSPGHVQVLISLSRGPHSVGQLAEAVGVSPPAVTQLVDRLVEHGIVERRHDEKDRRIVLVDYVPGMRDVARRIMESRRRQLEGAMEALTDEEAVAFLKGLKVLIESFGGAPGEEN